MSCAWAQAQGIRNTKHEDGREKKDAKSSFMINLFFFPYLLSIAKKTDFFFPSRHTLSVH